MSLLRAPGRLASGSAVVVVAAGLIIGPEAISRTAEEAAEATWKAVGRMLVRSEMAAMARQIDRDLAKLSDAQALRDALALNLRALEVRRRVNEIRSEEGPAYVGQGDAPGDQSDHHSDRFRGADPGPPQLDDAIAALTSAVVQADRQIGEARTLLLGREDDLLALRAQAEARRAYHQLGNLEGDRSRWEERSRFVAETLGGHRRGAK
jgi:hypothetical protein